jgi:hypothetical protein
VSEYKCYDCNHEWDGPDYKAGDAPIPCPKSGEHHNRISRERAVEILNGSRGRFITVEFTKRTTGERRVMTCRTGVTKHLKGGKRAYDPEKLGLAIVWETKTSEYKSIPTDAITAVRFGGKRMVVR